jgi:hypothetical protein
MVIPPIEQKPDGWYSQRWNVRVAVLPPDDLAGVSSELEAAARSSIQSSWVALGEQRSDPLRVTCRRSAPASLDLLVEVRSEQPDLRMGVVLATIQEIDRLFIVTHLEDVPRQDLRPWYLASREGSG